jgi:putative superfamily III holin-X
MQGRDGKAERSLGELFSELARDTSTLVSQEITLAKIEMTQKASRVGKDVGFLAAGGAVAYAGLLAILAGIIVLLGQVIPIWLSALLVGLVVAGVGYFLVRKGLYALKREDLAPRQTIETLKEDQQWAKDQTR